jgi:Undecaprenyl-phosphate galactose phosphotransferase WbaP
MSTAAQPRLATSWLQPVSWPQWVTLGADVLAFEFAFGLGLLVRYMLAPWLRADIGPEQYLGVAVGMLLLPAVNHQVGLHPGYLLGPVERLRRRMLATFAVFGGLIAWDNLVARGVFSRGVLLLTFVFASVLSPMAEMAARRWLLKRGRWGIPAVMLGCGETGRAVAHLLLQEPELGIRPIAFLDNRHELWNTTVESIPVIGPVGMASEVEDRAEAAIVSFSDMRDENALSLIQELNFPRLIVIPDMAGISSMWVTARDLGGRLGLEVKKNLLIRRNHILKLAMDRAIALPLFLISLPVIALAAILIKLSSRGPIFYRQMRRGAEGRQIPVWKLRTMYFDGEGILEEWFAEHPDDRAHWRRYFKLRHDPRVLPVIGELLRRTSLDELPQLWNVLKGEMSLVGPRPLPDYHLEQLPLEFRIMRTRVLPGLTGLWQVSARSDGDVTVLEDLDTFYIRNWSPWLDLYILVCTVRAVMGREGAY